MSAIKPRIYVFVVTSLFFVVISACTSASETVSAPQVDLSEDTHQPFSDPTINLGTNLTLFDSKNIDGQGLSMPYKLWGYDLHQIESSNGWTTYRLGIAIQNISDEVIEEVNIPFSDTYVETEGREVYPAEFHILYTNVYSDHKTLVMDASDAMGIFCNGYLPICPLPPRAIVLGAARKYSIFDEKANYGSISWEFSFRIPESIRLKRLVVPGMTQIDLINMRNSTEIQSSNIEMFQEMPVYFEAGDQVDVLVSNPRIIYHPDHAEMLAFDIDVENKDVNHEDVVYSFQVIGLDGLSLEDFSTECGSSERDGKLNQMPPMTVIGPSQIVSGVVCIHLRPINTDVDELWIWEIKSILEPAETGLDPSGVMEIEGLQVTFDQLREGVFLGENTRMVWIGNKRLGRIEIQEKQILHNESKVVGDAYFLTISIWIGDRVVSRTFRLEE